MKMARLRLKHVNAFANRNRKNNRLRYYFRRRGQKAIPLPGLPGSDEFMAAYAAALEGTEAAVVEIGASRTQPGTIDALCVSYYRSDAWTNLTEDTRESRYRVIERFRAANGSKRVALLEHEHIEKMLAKLDKGISQAPLVEFHSRADASRSPDFPQRRSDRRHHHQAPEGQGTSHVDR
jgi:hypothetical protein